MSSGMKDFDLEQTGRVDGAAGLVAHLEAVVGGRVVGGGDVDRPAGVLVDHGVGDDRGGGGAVGEVDPEPVGCQDFGDGRGEEFAVEALVVTDDDPFARVALVEQVTGEALGAAADVVEGVVFGDDAAPAVGSECDFEGHKCSPG